LPVRVSVVVPAYNSGPDIEPLIRSIAEQSLPSDEIEAIFVDDGSTDGTGARLDAVAAERPNVHVIHIPNSGWPGRPRNLGMDAARGEFIHFVDSDDHLGTEALERMYAMAIANESDVVVGKLVSNFRTIPPALFDVDRPRCSIHDAPLVSSLVTHKLFRTEFLRNLGIRFLEGRVRLEDQRFVLAALLAARNVSILSSYPCYYYMRRSDRSNIAATQVEPDAYYASVRDVIDILNAGTEPGAHRWRLLRRFYRNEILRRLSEPLTLAQESEFRHELFEAARAAERDSMPPQVVPGLGAMMQVRAALLQAGRGDDLYALAVRLDAISGRALVERVTWRDGLISVELLADLFDGIRQAPFVLVRRRGAKVIDPSLLEGFASDPVDARGSASKPRVYVQIRDRATSIAWPVSGRSEVEFVPVGVEPHGFRIAPRVRTTLTIDPLNVAGGSRLAPGSWELMVRVGAYGLERHTRAAMPAGVERDPVPGLVGSPPLAVVAGSDAEGWLELDVDRQHRTLASAVTPRQVRVTRAGRTVRAVLGIATSDDDPVPTVAVLTTAMGEQQLPATALRTGGRLEVLIDASGAEPMPGGDASLSVALDGTDQPRVELGQAAPGDGRVHIANVQPERRGVRAWSAGRRRLRRGVRRTYGGLPASVRRAGRRAWRRARAWWSRSH
jgi:poly(ribitol-phosphate) beta-N-acetylglucosaminyltransferase